MVNEAQIFYIFSMDKCITFTAVVTATFSWKPKQTRWKTTQTNPKAVVTVLHDKSPESL